MYCRCHIIPPDVLEKFRDDPQVAQATRQAFADTLKIDRQFRNIRREARTLTRTATVMMAPAGLMAAAPPTNSVFNCNHVQALPGNLVANPGASADPTIKQAFGETAQVAQFYQTLFGRNSIDGAGMGLVSSVHYGVGYKNAFWNGMQMTYGDGDGAVFVDFTAGKDVIAHELTHGVTQNTLQLVYTNEAGGLNESLSDCFGVMFKHWRLNKATTVPADWLIGADIMGPTAKAGGYICLRDMSNPASPKSLSQQPTHMNQFRPTMGPHTSSGIPNLAFYTFCRTLGGPSWVKPGAIWYQVLAATPPAPNLKMQQFADRTRAAAASLFPGDATLATALDNAWKKVGL